MTGKILLILFGLTVTTLFSLEVIGVLRLPLLHVLEFATYDARVRLSAREQVDPRIVIVDIDESSQRLEGRWPWRRDTLARLVDELTETYHAEVVAFDMGFPEAERDFTVEQLFELAAARNDLVTLERLTLYEPVLDRDAAFASSIDNASRVVLGYIFHHGEETGRTGQLPPPLFPAESRIPEATFAVRAGGYTGNLNGFQQHAADAGFFSNPVLDPDGVYRRAPLLMEFEGALYPSLPLAVAQTYLGATAEPVLAPGGDALGGYPSLEALNLAGVTIPLDANATTLVPYRGKRGSFPYVSAADVLRGTLELPQRLAGTIVLIGTTAAGYVDMKPTPVQNVFPRAEIQANLVAGILDGSIPRQPAYTLAVELLMVVASGLVLAVILPLTGPLAGGVATFATLAAVTLINAYAWHYQQQVLPLAASLSVIVLIYVVNAIYGFFFEFRSRSHLGRLFGQYVPPELVSAIGRNRGAYSLEGEKRELTVLFSDVRNFTTIAESMDPHDLARMMNSFLTPLTRAVHQNRGTIDKYMGDAMMAFWGAPLADPDHAAHAVATALQMVDVVDSLRKPFQERGWAEISVGIGINTGEMSVGNMGSEFRVAFTVMGDAVNLGSRLEGLAKRYGLPIVVSEHTFAQAPGFVYLEVDRVRVRGKASHVTIYTPMCHRDRASVDIEAFALKHAEALEDYRRRRFDAALCWFSQVPPLPQLVTLYEIYSQRIEVYRESPPDDDWDIVIDFDRRSQIAVRDIQEH